MGAFRAAVVGSMAIAPAKIVERETKARSQHVEPVESAELNSHSYSDLRTISACKTISMRIRFKLSLIRHVIVALVVRNSQYI